MTVLFLHN